MHEPSTHVAVEHGVDVLLVVALDDWGGEEEVGVGCGIAPLNVVDLGVSSVPLITKSQDQFSSIVLCSIDDVVQGLEDCLIVDTCQNGKTSMMSSNVEGTAKNMQSIADSSAICLHSLYSEKTGFAR